MEKEFVVERAEVYTVNKILLKKQKLGLMFAKLDAEKISAIDCQVIVKEQVLSFDVWSSKQGEPPPKLLTEPYVNLSIHTALIIRSST